MLNRTVDVVASVRVGSGAATEGATFVDGGEEPLATVLISGGAGTEGAAVATGGGDTLAVALVSGGLDAEGAALACACLKLRWVATNAVHDSITIKTSDQRANLTSEGSFASESRSSLIG